MAISPARDVARRALRRIEREDAFAAPALDAEIARARLRPEDRGLATELVYGVLRNRSRLDRALVAASSRGSLKVSAKLEAVLRVAAYQLLFLDRVPDHAAVDDAVQAARAVGGARVAGFVNGLLRGLARKGEPPIDTGDPGDEGDAATACSMPPWVVDAVKSALPGDDNVRERADALRALNESAPLAVRVSEHRVTAVELVVH